MSCPKDGRHDVRTSTAFYLQSCGLRISLKARMTRRKESNVYLCPHIFISGVRISFRDSHRFQIFDRAFDCRHEHSRSLLLHDCMVALRPETLGVSVTPSHTTAKISREASRMRSQSRRPMITSSCDHYTRLTIPEGRTVKGSPRMRRQSETPLPLDDLMSPSAV